MPLSNNDMRILIRLIENRLMAGYDPEIEDLLKRMKARLAKAEKSVVTKQ